MKQPLPKSVMLNFSAAELADIDECDLDILIGDKLSDMYGFCINSFQFKKAGENAYRAFDIDWDTSE